MSRFSTAMILTGSLLLALSFRGSAQDSDPMRFFAPEVRETQVAWEKGLLDTTSPGSLKSFHETITATPHPTGTEGDRVVISMLKMWFEAMNLEPIVQDLKLYCSKPILGDLRILQAPDRTDLEPITLNTPLSVIEDPLDEDPYSQNTDLWIGWNAYSGSGVADGEVVYVNYGRKEDFRKLQALGIDLKGKIAIARYGGNFRGFKAKFAEEAGASGLIIYTDPRDSGYVLGPVYPEGGYFNESSIQRGSILTLPYPGDPLTPYIEANESAERLDPNTIALPKIPVQPVGWRAAAPILARMEGDPVPDNWQGGLEFPYRIQGGPNLRVRLEVQQTREFVDTANVFAELRGSLWPEEKIILGCHFDAWGFGASDPHAGSMVLLECARILTKEAARGHRPARTIVFAHWGAEEAGILGSTEFCEAYRDELTKNAVAYVNLDMAAMGPNFNSSAAPLLKSVIADVTRCVPQARDKTRTVFEAWTTRGQKPVALPSLGSLGGGSDHVGFYCHLGIPSCGLSGSGSPGSAYHSNYDDFHWYQKVVGSDYEPARMITQVTALLAARLSSATILPMSPEFVARDIPGHIQQIERVGVVHGVEFSDTATEELRLALARLERSSEVLNEPLSKAISSLSPESILSINKTLIGLERSWVRTDGLPERPWYRNQYAATDRDSGYASWMLPFVRHSVEAGDQEMANREIRNLAATCQTMADNLDEIGRQFKDAQ